MKKGLIIACLIVSIAILGIEVYICDVIIDIVREILSECWEWWNASPKIW